ncbi:MAG: chemotaxis protein CheW [Burkholderiales bacterium]|nr:chemotaxis protein CheW [Burkholderiales bacterium]
MAKRISLREFQQNLVRRLGEAAASTEAPSARLGVQVGAESWLLRLEEAGEVMPVPPIARVPLTRAWYRGLTNIRGNLYGVVDLAAFQGGAETAITPDSRLVLVADRFNMASALLVSRMLGLRNIQALEPEDGQSGRTWERGRYKDGDGRLWHELGMSELVYHDEFLQAGL